MSGLGFAVYDFDDEIEFTGPVAVEIAQIIGDFVFECECLSEVTCTRVDATHVRIDFSSPVYLLPTLLAVAAYSLSPALTVRAVSAGPSTEAGTWDTVDYVTLTTDELSPVTYTATVFGAERA